MQTHFYNQPLPSFPHIPSVTPVSVIFFLIKMDDLNIRRLPVIVIILCIYLLPEPILHPSLRLIVQLVFGCLLLLGAEAGHLPLEHAAASADA